MGGGKLEDHYYIGNFADTNSDRNTVLTITVPASVRKNKPIQYAFAVAHYESDAKPGTVTSKDMSQNNNERSCTITGEGTFKIKSCTDIQQLLRHSRKRGCFFYS